MSSNTDSRRPVAMDDRKYRRRWWTLAILSLSLLIIGLDNTVLNVALPTLQREFHPSASELQWMVDAYILVFAGFLLTLGTLGDRYGRARMLQAGLLVFGVASFGAAFAQSAGQLITARAFMGIGGAAIMPATLSIIIDVFPREELGRAIGIWSGIAGVGIGLGPLIAGVLLHYYWWGSVFLVNVPIALIALGAGVALVPDSRDPDPPALDLPGALLSLVAVTGLVYAIIEAPGRGWLDPLELTAFGFSLLLVAGFAWRELATAAPMLDFGFFRNLRFSLGAAAIGFTFFALFGIIYLLTQYLQFVQGYSALEAGVRLIPVALGVTIGASQSHRWVAWLGTTKVVAGAMLALAIVLAAMSFWGPATSYWLIGLLLFLMALAMGNIMAPATESVMGSLPVANAGVGSAMNDVVRQVAGAFGVAILGSVVNEVYTARMDGATAGLPATAAAAASNSVGAALQVASQIGGPAAAALARSARNGFVDAFGISALIAAGVLVAGSVVVARYLPAESGARPEVEPEGQPAPVDAPAQGE